MMLRKSTSNCTCSAAYSDTRWSANLDHWRAARFHSRGSRVVFFVLLLLIKPCYEPVRFDFLTLIVNHSDFKVALDGISAHGAGPAFRIELACFFSTENQILLFRKAQKVSQNTKRTRWEA